MDLICKCGATARKIKSGIHKGDICCVKCSIKRSRTKQAASYNYKLSSGPNYKYPMPIESLEKITFTRSDIQSMSPDKLARTVNKKGFLLAV